MDLAWFDGELLVCGPDTRAHQVRPCPGTKFGLRFAPGHLPRLLGVPAHALTDVRAPLVDVLPDGPARATVELARARLETHPGSDGLLRLASELGPERHDLGLEDELTRLLRSGARVGAVADRLGLGTRQVHRRCRQAFGYGPKVLSRVLRLQRALELGRAGHEAARVAHDAGYADQPHLAREVRALASTTWGELTRPGGPGAQPSAA